MQHWRNNHLSRCFAHWKWLVEKKRLLSLQATLKEFEASSSDEEQEENQNLHVIVLNDDSTTTETFSTPPSPKRTTNKLKRHDTVHLSNLLTNSPMISTPRLPSSNVCKFNFFFFS